MDVILHLGAHRCATTTLQMYLARNAAALARAGIAIWTPDRTRGGLFAGLVQRPQDITLADERLAHRSMGVIAVETGRLEQAGTRRLIVSEENMLGTLPNNLREGALYPLLDKRARRFRAAFGPRVRGLALAIRSYEGYWSSALAFAVAQGRPMPTAAQVAALVDTPRGWRAVIAEIASGFPGVPLTVWPFEALASRPEAQLALLDPGLQLLNATGARDRLNPAPGRDKLRTLMRLRGDIASMATLPDGDGRWTPFDARAQAELRARYAADLEWLASGADGLAQWAGPVHNGDERTGDGWHLPATPDRRGHHERERQMV